MDPVARDGQYVFCDTKTPVPGDLVVCELLDGRAFFRRLELKTRGGTYLLASVNASQSRWVELDPAEVRECYHVVGSWYLPLRENCE